jgi:hypothetical protein
MSCPPAWKEKRGVSVAAAVSAGEIRPSRQFSGMKRRHSRFSEIFYKREILAV